MVTMVFILQPLPACLLSVTGMLKFKPSCLMLPSLVMIFLGSHLHLLTTSFFFSLFSLPSHACARSLGKLGTSQGNFKVEWRHVRFSQIPHSYEDSFYFTHFCNELIK